MATRTTFLRSGAAAAAATAAARPSPGFTAPIRARPPPVASADDRLGTALVLSGGGATGSYEAGVISALVTAEGVKDGEPLPGIDAVVGTSIGSLNGWFVATGQYARLASTWHEISERKLFRLKRRYAAVMRPGSFVLSRIIAALALEHDISTNVTGVLDRDRVAAFIAQLVDPALVPLLPLFFTATNLSRERAEIFFRANEPPSAAVRANGEHRLRAIVGPRQAVHEATPDLLRLALLASTAIPVFFEPVVMRFENGQPDQYIDGGIADNTPVDVARVIARSVRTIIVDPKHIAHRTFENAVAIDAESLGVAERRSLQKSLRSAKLESEGARVFAGAPTTAEQRAFLANVFPAELSIIQPETELPLHFEDFDDQRAIDDAYARGVADGAAGFVPYEVPAASG